MHRHADGLAVHSGAVFITWPFRVFLFTPGIDYHLATRTFVHADDCLCTLQPPCQAALHHGNRDYDNDLRDTKDVTLGRWQRGLLWEKAAGPFVWILERQQ